MLASEVPQLSDLLRHGASEKGSAFLLMHHMHSVVRYRLLNVIRRIVSLVFVDIRGNKAVVEVGVRLLQALLEQSYNAYMRQNNAN